MTSRKIVIIRQITEYYDLAKKKILGEVAEEFETGIANILQRNKTEKTEKESVKKATGYDVGKEENKTEKNKCNMDQSQLQTKQATKPLTTTPSITKKLSVSAYVRSLDMTCPTEHLLRQLLVHYENGISTFTFLTGTEAFAKRIVKATAAYASIESGETPLLLEDHTLFGSAKEGIVLTDKMLYYRNAIMGVKVKLPIGEIQEVTWKCQTKDLYYIEAVSQKGKFKLSSRNKEAVAVKTAEFYTDVFYLLKQLQKNKNSTNNSLEKVISVGTPGVVTPNDYWNCMCGNVCRGKFCPKCGKAKDNSVNLWTCTCGNVNKGKFCTKCGKPK